MGVGETRCPESLGEVAIDASCTAALRGHRVRPRRRHQKRRDILLLDVAVGAERVAGDDVAGQRFVGSHGAGEEGHDRHATGKDGAPRELAKDFHARPP